MEQTTERDSSLEFGGRAIAGLLSGTPEDTQKRETQSEQSPATETEQTPAAPEASESEPEESTEQADETAPPRTFKVKIDGQEHEVTEDDLIKGYSRTEDYTRKTQQLALERKTFQEQDVAQVRTQINEYWQYLAELKTALTNLRPTEPNWVELRAKVSPDVFAAELLNWQQTQKRLETIDAEQSRVKEAQAADAAQGFRQYLQREQAKLADVIPEFKDPEKGKVLKASLNEFAKTRGFTDDELASVADHRMIVLLHDAYQHQTAKAKAPAIQNKIDRLIENTAPGPKNTAPRKSELDVAKTRLKTSHSVEDGGAAIAALLKGEQK